MSTTDVAMTIAIPDSRRRPSRVPRLREATGLIVLVVLGLTLGASLLFAKSFVPADSSATGAGHDARGSEAQPPVDPHC